MQKVLKKRNGVLRPVFDWAVKYSRRRAKERKTSIDPDPILLVSKEALPPAQKLRPIRRSSGDV